MPAPTSEQYADTVDDVHAAIVTVIASEAAPAGGENNAQVVGEYVYNTSDDAWLGELLSDDDKDAQGKKRVHTWFVSYVGPDGNASAGTSDYGPTIRFKVRFFYPLKYGDGSEARARREVSKVEWALARATDLGIKPKVLRHFGLQMRIEPSKLGGQPVREGFGEIRVQLQPLPLR